MTDKEKNRLLILIAASALAPGPLLFLAAVLGGVGGPWGLVACGFVLYPLWCVLCGVLAGRWLPRARYFPAIPPLCILLSFWWVAHAVILQALIPVAAYAVLCWAANAATIRWRKGQQK